MSARTSKTITVDTLARLEGEGGLKLTVKDGALTDVQLRIHESPRLFEAFLRGRSALEAPDITARICGICPVAHQTSAALAIEKALGVEVGERVRALRRLLYCGEWIESHALHIYLLHAPDFLGYPSGIHLAADHPDVVKRGLEIKKVGNDVMTVVGGREIHPINVRVGGFHRAPSAGAVKALREPLQRALESSVETAAWVCGFTFPDFEPEHEQVALRQEGLYPVDGGERIVSTGGVDAAPAEYLSWFREEHVAHSNALHSVRRGHGSYEVGPLARLALNADRLGPAARAALVASGLAPGCRNPFRGVIARAVELVEACAEALRLVDAYAPPDPPAVPVTMRAGQGAGCTEAPRGLLYHGYRLDGEGRILEARIIPPTAQNLKCMEDDLWRLLPAYVDGPADALRDRAEALVRSYDPCLSCATHFLDVRIDRR